MKIKQKIELTFGDLITAAPQIWGAGRAKLMMRLASDAHPVGFRERLHSLISLAKGMSL